MPQRSARPSLFSTETPFGGAGGSVTVAVGVGVGVGVASGVPRAAGESAEANTTRMTMNLRAKGVVGVDLNDLIVAFLLLSAGLTLSCQGLKEGRKLRERAFLPYPGFRSLLIRRFLSNLCESVQSEVVYFLGRAKSYISVNGPDINRHIKFQKRSQLFISWHKRTAFRRRGMRQRSMARFSAATPEIIRNLSFEKW